MEFKLLFENHPKYDLQPGDKIMIVDQKIGPVGIVFIRRKEGSKCANGIYSCKTGELLLSEAEFDDIQVIKNSGYHGSEFYYKVIKGKKVGACSMDGTLVQKPENLDITELVDGALIVKTGCKTYAAYSESGEELLPPKYTKMKREKSFIIASHGDFVSVIHGGKVLVEEVKAAKISKSWRYVVLHKENSALLISARNVVKEFEGTARARQGDCIEITAGDEQGIVYALNGSYVIPMGKYKSIRKKENTLVAECEDGSIVSGEIH